MKYIVNCTKIYNGEMHVEASSQEEAVAKVQERLQKDRDSCDWNFDEVTADFAELDKY